MSASPEERSQGRLVYSPSGANPPTGPSAGRSTLAHVAQSAAARSTKQGQPQWANRNNSDDSRLNSLTRQAEPWKAVGQRIASSSVPELSSSNEEAYYGRDEGLGGEGDEEHPHSLRTRTTSVPQNVTEYARRLSVALEETGGAGGASGSWNGTGTGPRWQTTQAQGWNEGGAPNAQSSPTVVGKPTFIPAEAAVSGAAFPSRQFRSYSFSFDSMSAGGLGGNGYSDSKSGDGNHVTTAPLRGGDDDDDSDDYNPVPTFRSRSKSSSEIYGLLSAQEQSRYTYPAEVAASPETPPADFGAMKELWQGTGSRVPVEPDIPSITHRRASVQSGVTWGSNGDRHGAQSTAYTARQDRRFSHTPGLYQNYGQELIAGPPHGENNPYDLARRRHSVAGPLYGSSIDPDYIAAGLQNMRINEQSGTPFLDEIDDYFENTNRRTKAWVEAGKNLQMHAGGGGLTYTWPLYIVEFKAGRKDFFFHTPDAHAGILPVKRGDLVIVEADRGKDLGKIIHDNVLNVQQLQMFQAQFAESLPDSHNPSKEVHPKRIYRAAVPAEVTMLVSKSQDEAKAVAVCQTKIRQKKLPMEVVDAEYQWDRRKLTFYFVADRRIDFRELVRELFKLYKTRIWMCAVNPMKTMMH